MFVDSLISDDPECSAEGHLTWDQIRRAIEGLNGEAVSEVSIAKRKTEAHMSISGGRGHYLISATLDNDVFFDAINLRGDPKSTIRMVSGGQPVTVGMNEIVDLETALRISKVFADDGLVDPSASWIRNPPA